MITWKTLENPQTSSARLAKALRGTLDESKRRAIFEHPNFNDEVFLAAVEEAITSWSSDLFKTDKITSANSVTAAKKILAKGEWSGDDLLGELIQHPQADGVTIRDLILEKGGVRDNWQMWLRSYCALIETGHAGAEMTRDLFELVLENVPEDGTLRPQAREMVQENAYQAACAIAAGPQTPLSMLKYLSNQSGSQLLEKLYSNPNTPLQYAKNLTWEKAPSTLRERVLQTIEPGEEYIWIEQHEKIGDLLEASGMFTLDTLQTPKELGELQTIIDEFKSAAAAAALLTEEGFVQLDADTVKKIRQSVQTVRASVNTAVKAWQLDSSQESERVRKLALGKLQGNINSFRTILASLLNMAEKAAWNTRTELEVQHRVRGWEELAERGGLLA